MKLILLALFTFAFYFSSSAAFITTTSTTSETVIEPSKNVASLSDLTTKQLEHYLGRKLTLKEKVRWYFGKKALAKLQTEEEDLAGKKARSKAYLGFGLSLAGLIIFPLLVIPGIIFSNNALALEKEKPGVLGDAKGFARAGQIIGWITIGLIVVALVIILAFLTALGAR